MTPERLAKIRAIASDPRANPNIRAVAQRFLEAQPKERWKPPPDRPAPGIQTSEEFKKIIFFSIDQWGESKKGNYVHTIDHKEGSYKFVLFRYPRNPDYWGWLCTDLKNKTESWCHYKYHSLREAQDGAWTHLMAL